MARRKLGQHFLVSGKALNRIADAACGPHVELVVEIGPGRGALTECLLDRADRVAAIELDPVLAAYLRERWSGERRLEIVEGDALNTYWGHWGPGVLAGNLPYYIATPLITRYLHSPGPLRQAVFLIQREVADRITAAPGGREYGYLSVECQLLAEVEYLFTVQPGAFRPPPEVESAVIRLTPRATFGVPESDRFLKFVSACFRQKRKTLRNNLAALYPASVLADLPDMSRRAETLTVPEFIALYSLLTTTSSVST